MKHKPHKRKWISAIGVLALSLITCPLLAQENSGFWNKDMQKIADPKSKTGWVYLKPEAKINTTALFTKYGRAFGLSRDDQMVMTKNRTDILGWTHYKFLQYYKGHKVEGASYRVHEQNGYVQKGNGTIIKGMKQSGTPSVSKEAALQNALRHVDAQLYAWEDPGRKAYLRDRFPNKEVSEYPEGQLVWTFLSGTEHVAEDYQLAWYFEVRSTIPSAVQGVYVDGQTGQILKSQSTKGSCTPTTFTSPYAGYGSQEMVVTQNFSDFELTEFECLDGRTITTRLEGVAGPIKNVGSNVWDGCNLTNFEICYGAQAHYATEQFYDMLKVTFGRNSYDDLGSQMDVLLRTDNQIYKAFYDNGEIQLHYTHNSSAQNAGFVTSLDIVGHEWGHGVNDTEIDYGMVTSADHERGAIDEAIPDIFGVMNENYATGGGPVDWEIGEDILNVPSYLLPIYYRSCIDPPARCNPDCWFSEEAPACTGGPGLWDFTVSQSNPHGLGGVIRKWFYILSEGETGSNHTPPTYYSYDVPGIGADRAFQLLYYAMVNYMTDYPDFTKMRDETLEAAKNLFANSPTYCMDMYNVNEAWRAVGVYGDCNSPAEDLALFNACGSTNGEFCIIGRVWDPSATITWSNGPPTYPDVNQNLVPGPYSLSYSNACATTQTVNVIVTSNPAITGTSFTYNLVDDCEDEAIAGSTGGSGSYTYTWPDGSQGSNYLPGDLGTVITRDNVTGCLRTDNLTTPPGISQWPHSTTNSSGGDEWKDMAVDFSSGLFAVGNFIQNTEIEASLVVNTCLGCTGAMGAYYDNCGDLQWYLEGDLTSGNVTLESVVYDDLTNQFYAVGHATGTGLMNIYDNGGGLVDSDPITAPGIILIEIPVNGSSVVVGSGFAPSTSEAYAVDINDMGDVFIGGNNGTNAYLAKVFPPATLKWNQAATGGTSNINALELNDAGNMINIGGDFVTQLVLPGITMNAMGTDDGFVIRYYDNNPPIPVWSSQLRSDEHGSVRGLASGPGDDVFVVGDFSYHVINCFNTTTTLSFSTPTGYVARLSSATGSLLWMKNMEGSRDILVNDVAFNASGVYVTGQFAQPYVFIGGLTPLSNDYLTYTGQFSNSAVNKNIFTFAFDPSTATVQLKARGDGDGEHGSNAVALNGLGNFFLAGQYVKDLNIVNQDGSQHLFSAPSTDHNGFIVRLDQLSGVYTKKEEEAETGPAPLPAAAWDMKVYPNPSGGQFSIQLSGAIDQENVAISVYNLVGQKMEVSAAQQASDLYSLDLQSTSAGMYLLEISDGNTKKIQRIVIQ